MKKLFFLLCLASCLASCSVQHFNVNTSDSGDNWKVFGEKTKGKEVRSGGDFFIIGIAVNQTDTKALAEQMGARSYTIETKYNFLGLVIRMFTGGIVNYKVVKVIKR